MDWHPKIYNWLWPGRPARRKLNGQHDEPIHGLLGLLHILEADATLPEAKNDARHRNIAHHLRVESVLKTYWPSNLSRPLIMKGFDYVTNLYPEIGLRRANDIDLLVSSDEFTKVCRVLRKHMTELPMPVENRWPHEQASAQSFRCNDIAIDVHRVPVMDHQTRLEMGGLFDRAVDGMLGELPVLFPDSLDRLWLWLHNFAKNSQPLAVHHMLDFTLILKDLNLHNYPESSWDELALSASSHGLHSQLRTALRHLENLALWCEPIPKNQQSRYLYSFDHWIRQQGKEGWLLPFHATHRVLYSIPGSRGRVMLRLFERLYRLKMNGN